jgi:hypothetical protein
MCPKTNTSKANFCFAFLNLAEQNLAGINFQVIFAVKVKNDGSDKTTNEQCPT